MPETFKKIIKKYSKKVLESPFSCSYKIKILAEKGRNKKKPYFDPKTF